MKKVIITGASGNLGKATVEKFLTLGYHVIATVSPGKSLPYKTTGSLETVELDLINEQAVSNTFADLQSRHQQIDAALFLVGGFAMGSIEQTDGSLLKKMHQINFESAYYLARLVFGQMMKQKTGGRIVFVGSRPALEAKEGHNKLAYALSKSLLFNLADYLNIEGSPQNVTASVIVPSTIDTPENRTSMPKADPSRWVKPAELAETMAFICSDQGSPLRSMVYKVYGQA